MSIGDNIEHMLLTPAELRDRLKELFAEFRDQKDLLEETKARMKAIDVECSQLRNHCNHHWGPDWPAIRKISNWVTDHYFYQCQICSEHASSPGDWENNDGTKRYPNWTPEDYHEP